MKNNTGAFSLFRIRNSPSSTKRGFTLLLAAIISAIVLSVGLAIYSIAQKQLLLSSLGKYSQFAFYNADSGAECALYWDVRQAYFSTSTPPTQITCNAQGSHVTYTQQGGSYSFSFQYAPNGNCANVTLTKTPDTANPNVLRTSIHADGFNVACTQLAISPIALQRSVDLNY